MDHDVIVEPLLARCKRFIEHMLPAPALHSSASASLAIFTPRRPLAREMLQAQLALEAQPRRNPDVARCCPQASVP